MAARVSGPIMRGAVLPERNSGRRAKIKQLAVRNIDPLERVFPSSRVPEPHTFGANVASPTDIGASETPVCCALRDRSAVEA